MIWAFDVVETTKKSAGRHSYIGEVELELPATASAKNCSYTRIKPYACIKLHILSIRYQANWKSTNLRTPPNFNPLDAMTYSLGEPWLRMVVLFIISTWKGLSRYGHFHKALSILNKFLSYFCTPYAVDGIRTTCKILPNVSTQSVKVCFIRPKSSFNYVMVALQRRSSFGNHLLKTYFALHNFSYTHSQFFGSSLKALIAKVQFKTLIWSSVALALVTGSGMCKLNVAGIRWEHWL